MTLSFRLRRQSDKATGLPGFCPLLVYQQKFRAENGECRGCSLSWPEGTEGVPPRPQFEDDGFARILEADRRSPARAR